MAANRMNPLLFVLLWAALGFSGCIGDPEAIIVETPETSETGEGTTTETPETGEVKEDPKAEEPKENPKTPDGCPVGYLSCRGVCALSDEYNCGVCGNACPENSVCTDGSCICREGLSVCTSECIDLKSDMNHCGKCDVSCEDKPNVESSACNNGKCEIVCRQGYGDCNNNPADGCEVNLMTDARHCGACSTGQADHQCSSECRNGECKSCPEGFIEIPSGTYFMGSKTEEFGRQEDETYHFVSLTHSFCLMDREVIKSEFLSLMPDVDVPGKDPLPVAVSWHQAAAFANALSTRDGKHKCYDCSYSGSQYYCKYKSHEVIYACDGYRLPTEAEWEYAARGGTETSFYNGNCADEEACDALSTLIGWISVNTFEVKESKQKAANSYGLYDMTGNLSEWCHDSYYKSYEDQTGNPVYQFENDPRVLRGGSIHDFSYDCRNASRLKASADSMSSDNGFRIAISI